MSSIFRAQYLNRSQVPGLVKVTVRQKFENHTLVFLDYEFTNRTQYSLPSEMTPVSVQWGESPLGVGATYGYLNHYETTTQQDSSNTITRFVVIGTSHSMNSSNPDSWAEATRSGIFRDIAKRYKLRTVMHSHPTVVPNWTTGSLTDFQALKRLGDEAGYRVWVDGSTAYFLDPERLSTKAPNASVPKFTAKSIRSAKVTGGTNAPRESGAARRRVLRGLDYRTNEFFEATSGDPKYPTQTITQPANTYAEADDVTKGFRTEDYYTLDMVISGSAEVHPGRLIWLDGDDVTTDRAGFWTVDSAVHEIDRKDFVTRVTATRKQNDRLRLLTPSSMQGVRHRTGAIVRDGRHWEAELQEHVDA